jgi:membrane protease YdiL (CAAX protease family)
MPDDVAKSYVARVVTFVLTPILLPVAGVVANWGQDVLGLDLNGADLTAYVVSVMVGLALVIYSWVKNRGEWEVAAATVEKLHKSGQDVIGRR